MPAPPLRLPPGAFLGDVVRSLDVADLLLRETRHHGRQIIPPHVHEGPHFCLGVAGACVERIGARRVECVPGTLEYHPAGTCHASRWEAAGGRCFTVTLGDPWHARLAEDDAEIRPHPGVLDAAARGLMLRIRDELRQAGPSSPLVVEGLTLAMIGEARRAGERRARGRPPAWLRLAEAYIRDHAGRGVSAGAAAAAAGVHPVVLSRWFRRAHGVTIGEFVRRLRLERASALLATTARPLSDVAHDCGFADHAHFTRSFRRLTGVTPSAYRQGLVRRLPEGPS